MCYFFYKALNGYYNIDIDVSAYVQLYSDTARYSLRGKYNFTVKKNYARTNTFKFSFLIVLWTCGTCFLFKLEQLLVFQASSFKRRNFNKF